MQSTKPFAPRNQTAVVVTSLDEIHAKLVDVVAEAIGEIIPRNAGPPPLLDCKGAAAYLGVSTDTLDKLTRSRGLPAHRVGGSPRFDRDEVRAWVLAQSAESETSNEEPAP